MVINLDETSDENEDNNIYTLSY